MSTYSTNLKVNRAIAAATAVNTNCYVIANYRATFVTSDGVNGIASFSGAADFNFDRLLTRYFGPAQSVPLTFQVPMNFNGLYGGSVTFVGFIEYTLISGVEFANTQ